eukprot:9724950-Lingulodinium_polyedra.AAC.1
MDIFICKKLRVLLRGKASWLEEGQRRSWSNLQVLRHWRILPAVFERAVRLVAWLRSMLSEPSAHRQVVASVWGTVHLEGEPAFSRSALDAKGHLGPFASPYAKMFEQALRWYENLEGWREFFDVWRELGDSWEELFKSEELKELFVRADPSELRACFWLGGKGPWDELLGPHGEEEEHQQL